MLCVPPPALAKQILSWANKAYELVDIRSNTLYLNDVSSSLWCAAEKQLCLGKSPSEGEMFMHGTSKFIAVSARWEQAGARSILAGQPLLGPWEENSCPSAPSVISARCMALLFPSSPPSPSREAGCLRHGGSFLGWPLPGFAASAVLLGNHRLLAACGG